MYDLVVIGAGPGGYVAALRAAQLGAAVAVVERDKLGGCCLNRGCIPTKALVRAAEVYTTVKDAGTFGTGLAGGAEAVSLDMPAVMARKRQVVAQLVGGVERLLGSAGVTVHMGTASVAGPGKVAVAKAGGGTEVLDTKYILLATGSQPAQPPVPEEDLAHTIGSDEALELEEVPPSMLVIGGGVLGVEFACIYGAFGSDIRMIKRTPNLLPAVDEEIAKRLAMSLKKRGMQVNTGVFTKRIEKTSAGKVVICDTADGGEARFEAHTVMVAMGRVPDFGGIDLGAMGVESDRRGIRVDDRMRTTARNVYAIGDAVGRTYLASVASAEGIVAVEDMFAEHKRDMDYRVVPGVVFSNPECASVGLDEKDALEQAAASGREVVVSKFPFTANGKAIAMGETEGLVKLVADKTSGELLGMHVMGPHASDLIHEGAIALRARMTGEDLARIVFAHPTLSETVMEAAHGVHGQPLHLASVRRR
ncbi:MAG: dihydrolipoyl dehydrogenase [Bacillota bacterium]|nr:MAG: dihydrolipoyl dehydrogenase [Bacillota bacterium]